MYKDIRIRRPSDYKQLMDDLKLVFNSYKDMMLFSAAYGFKYGKRIQFIKTEEKINYNLFKNNNYNSEVIDCIALAETGDINILDDSNRAERIQIFEEYAYAGLGLIDELHRNANDDEGFISDLTSLILDQYKTEDSIIDDISNL